MPGLVSSSPSIQRKVNDTVRLTVTLTKNGQPQSGKTVLVKFQRRSDGKFWNFNLSVWQTPAVAKALTENATVPGVYEVDFDQSAADPGAEREYLAVFSANGIPADRFYGTVEYVFRNRTVDEIVDGTHHFATDSVGHALTLLRNRFYGGFAVLDNTTFNAKGHMLTGRWRIFDSKTDAENATDGGTGEGEIATILLTAQTEPTDARLTKIFKAIRQ